MIIIKIKGGIGNQLFQYALGKSLSIKNNTQLLLDTSFYAGQDLRAFELNAFMIEAKIASPSDIESITPHGFTKIMDQCKPYNRRKIIHEKNFGFDPKILEVKNPAYLDGYWQSEKYFSSIAQILREEFRLKVPLPSSSHKLLEKIMGVNAISVHIRRGDYLTQKHESIFYHCPPTYYAESVKILQSKVRQPVFFVFSDDIPWARTLEFPEGTIFVGTEYGLLSYQELFVMACCKHNIIANSSFSYWGAWLNSNPEKIVIAPKKYFNDETIDTSNWTPPTWIRP